MVMIGLISCDPNVSLSPHQAEDELLTPEI